MVSAMHFIATMYAITRLCPLWFSFFCRNALVFLYLFPVLPVCVLTISNQEVVTPLSLQSRPETVNGEAAFVDDFCRAAEENLVHALTELDFKSVTAVYG